MKQEVTELDEEMEEVNPIINNTSHYTGGVPTPILEEGDIQTSDAVCFHLGGFVKNVVRRKNGKASIIIEVQNSPQNAYYGASHIQCCLLSAMHFQNQKRQKHPKTVSVNVNITNTLKDIVLNTHDMVYGEDATLFELETDEEGNVNDKKTNINKIKLDKSAAGLYAVFLVAPSQRFKELRHFKFDCYDAIFYREEALMYDFLEQILASKKVPRKSGHDLLVQAKEDKKDGLDLKQLEDAAEAIEHHRRNWSCAYLGVHCIPLYVKVKAQ